MKIALVSTFLINSREGKLKKQGKLNLERVLLKEDVSKKREKLCYTNFRILDETTNIISVRFLEATRN